MLTIKQGTYFPWMPKGIILVTTSVVCYSNITVFLNSGILTTSNVILSFCLILILIILFTTCNQIDINPLNKNLYTYISLLSLKLGKKRHIGIIEKIFINKVNMRQSLPFPVGATSFIYNKDIEDCLYKSYIKFENEKRYF